MSEFVRTKYIFERSFRSYLNDLKLFPPFSCVTPFYASIQDQELSEFICVLHVTSHTRHMSHESDQLLTLKTCQYQVESGHVPIIHTVIHMLHQASSRAGTASNPDQVPSPKVERF